MLVRDLEQIHIEADLASCIVSLLTDGTVQRLHAYMGRTVLVLGVEAAQMRGESTRELECLKDLHGKAAIGDMPVLEHWLDALEDAYLVLFRLAFVAEKTYRVSHSSALEFAAGNKDMIESEFGSAEAYADYYGTLNSEANTRAFARANAQVHSNINAKLFTDGSLQGADTTTLLSLFKASAYAFACAHAFGELERRYCEALLRLVRGLQTIA
ncbi:hypothetical protein [Pseudovibrio sp. POLY-S9]|uniref:hypothetical protein n=1 Tax=Pseudovibrio sp. POLY-S9 TaxID=1576596 RepID=UPI00070B7A9D|nr:hypothetical protein [Pseudovibrio sp. POLY-S9]